MNPSFLASLISKKNYILLLLKHVFIQRISTIKIYVKRKIKIHTWILPISTCNEYVFTVFKEIGGAGDIYLYFTILFSLWTCNLGLVLTLMPSEEECKLMLHRCSSILSLPFPPLFGFFYWKVSFLYIPFSFSI